MARRRMIDPSFWDDEDVGQLSDSARLLLLACISNADDHGKLSGSPTTLKKVAFGFTDYSNADTDRLLAEIADHIRGFHRYHVNGRQYIALLHWYKYQRVDHPSDSTLPDPPDAQFDPPEYRGYSKNDSQSESESTAGQLDREIDRELVRETNQPSNKRDKEKGAAPHPLFSHPLYQAYLAIIAPGTTATPYQQRSWYAAIVALKDHPLYETAFADVGRCKAAFRQYLRERPNQSGERKPLTYYLPWMRDLMDSKLEPGIET